MRSPAVRKDVVFAPTLTDAAEFTVSFWKVEPGEAVDAGAELVVLESVEEKTAIAVESPCSGVLAEIVAGEDAAVRPGDVLGRIETP
jgi:pyruvate/2-oxoglutarate dehydrogenase complex dihydrolipoamide acyltransferase (E2) component